MITTDHALRLCHSSSLPQVADLVERLAIDKQLLLQACMKALRVITDDCTGNASDILRDAIMRATK